VSGIGEFQRKARHLPWWGGFLLGRELGKEGEGHPSSKRNPSIRCAEAKRWIHLTFALSRKPLRGEAPPQGVRGAAYPPRLAMRSIERRTEGATGALAYPFNSPLKSGVLSRTYLGDKRRGRSDICRSDPTGFTSRRSTA